MKKIFLLLVLSLSFYYVISLEQSLASTRGIQVPTTANNLQSLIGNTGEQKMHGAYENNTNACASCHNTHTAAGNSLLIRDGIYSTCTSCHDGTLGVYNIYSPSTAGTFSGSTDGNPSKHLATGALHIKAAPGGINGAGLTEDEIKTKGGNWLSEFNCASCHSPHGSYSDRLLHYNPNNMGNTDIKNGGNKAILVPVLEYNSQGLSKIHTDDKEPTGYHFVLLRGTKANHKIIDSKIKETDTVIALYEWKSGTYIRTETPWLYGYTYGTPKKFWTQFYKTNVPDYLKDSNGNYSRVVDFNDEDVHFQFNKGYVYTSGSQLSDVVRGDIAQAYVVKLDKVKIGEFGNSPIYAINQAALHQGPVDPKGTAMNDPSISKMDVDGKQIAINLGKSMSKFCSACHSDYLAHSGEAVGVFNPTSFRHSTDEDYFNCVRCHFAHGSDVTIMNDANGKTMRDMISINNWSEAEAKAYLLDQNPSSALKRYTNMTVCLACHKNTSSQQMFNDPYAQRDQFLRMPDLIPYSEKQ